MILIDRDEKGIVLHAPLTAAGLAREIPGARHDSKAQVWRYPLSWATCVVARGVFGDQLKVGPALAAWAAEEKQSRIAPALALREATG